MIVLLAALVGATPAPVTEVYTVDLGRAILATPAGKSISAELSKLHRAEEAEIRKAEDALASRRDRIAPKDYAAEVERLQQRIAGAEKRLGAKQDELLAPQLERMRAFLKLGEKRAKGEIRIVAKTDAPFVAPPKPCDATAWLTEAAKAGAVKAPPKRSPACRFSHFLYVDFDEVLKQTRDAKGAMAELDATKEKYQSELDLWQKQLAELDAKANETGDPKWRREHTRLAREVEEKYGRLQQQLAEKELKAQSRLYGEIEATLVRIAAQVKGIAFVERLSGSTLSLEPRCEVSEWVAGLVDEHATVADLKAACPALAAARGR